MSGLPRRTLAWLFALALGARLAVLPWTLERYDHGRAYPDTLQYEAMAGNLLAGQGLVLGEGAVALRPPLYPLFLAAFQLLFPDDRACALAAILGQVVLGALTAALAGDLGARLFGTGAGRLAGIAAGLHPELLLYPSLLLTETLAAMLVTAALWAAVRARARHQMPWGLASGVLAGMAALTRASLLILPLALALWLALSLFSGRRSVAAALACLLGAAAALLPWTARNHARLGAWIPVTTKMGADLYEQCCPEATGGPIYETIRWPEELEGMGEVEADRFLRERAWDCVREDPVRALKLAARRLGRLWNPLPNDAGHRGWGMLAVALLANLPLFGLALLSLRRVLPRAPAPWLLAAMPVLLLTAIHTIFMGSVRYRAPALPGLAILAAAALPARREEP